MTESQFNLIATLTRSRDPIKSAVRMVLLEGQKSRVVLIRTGLSAQSLSNALSRYRAAHTKILAAYQVNQ